MFKLFHGMTDSTIVNGVIPPIRRVAKKNKLELLDLHEVIIDEKYMSADGAHPNEHGAKELAKAVEAIIRGVRSKK